ncbi:alpha-L-rhamnosidase [Flavihumibacter petaseus]|nr:alpha-L-rhamnosidase [Flavihumibacter petaseus]
MIAILSRKPAFALVFLFLVACTGALRAQTVSQLQPTVQYAVNPLGIDETNPVFGWTIPESQRSFRQRSYQVLVADDPALLTPATANVWNSGLVTGAVSSGITYAGKPLESRRRYYWKVLLQGVKSPDTLSSDVANFEMGLMQQSDWRGDWISYPFGWVGRVLYYRCVFPAGKPLKRARAYVSGIGYYTLKLNSKKVGNCVLDPATSDYAKSVYYNTFDIAPYLTANNVMMLTVAPGWYGQPKMRLQVELEFTDGSQQSFTSSDMRIVTLGPIQRAGILDGEYYDAREEHPEWWLPTDTIIHGLPSKHWGVAHSVEPPGGRMRAQQLEPIEVVETIRPVAVSQPKPGVYVVDAGQNLAGWAALKLAGKRGDKVELRFAETLYPDGTINQENLRTAAATDTYIFKGEGTESWEPSFTYHGFRYIQVEGLSKPPAGDELLVRRVRSSVPVSGTFNSSNPLLNRIYKMVQHTEASNLHSIPTDCPQRDERMGWMNDLTVRIEQALYNFNMARFYPKFLQDVVDTQHEDGDITDTAPYRVGGRPADPVSASFLLLAAESYRFYGNGHLVEKHYTALKAWVDMLEKKTVDGVLEYSYYGDWSPPAAFSVNGQAYGALSKNTPGNLMSTGYLYYSAALLSKMAGVIRNPSDSIRYAQLAQRTAAVFNNKFYNAATGGYGSNNQSCNSFALFLGIVPADKLQRVVANLKEDVVKHDFHLTTGNLCTKYLLESLTENGEVEAAYRIATQETYPSWGYMLSKGATTLWERWEYETGGSMNSHNHPMMGSVGSWFYKYLVGIVPEAEHAGFERFTIRPYLPEHLQFVEGSYHSVKGMIRSSWKKEKGKVQFTVTVPPNSVAKVYIPAHDPKSVRVNGKSLKAAGITASGTTAQAVMADLQPGEYHFSSKW